MAEASNELIPETDPRLYAGHPLHPILKFMARPKGKVSNFRAMGHYLYADLKGVDPKFWEQLQADKARFSPDMAVNYRSPKTGKQYPWVITGLGALGAVIPANPMLPPVGTDFASETHYFARAFSAEVRRLEPSPSVVKKMRVLLKGD